MRTSLLTATFIAATLTLGAGASIAGERQGQYRANASAQNAIPPGYAFVRTYGANRYLATRNGRLFFIQGSNITYLNPRYDLAEQIDKADTRRGRFYD